MFKKVTGFFGAIALAASLGISGEAVSAPMFSTFGPLPEATFGGSGIPNDNVAITTITTGAVGLETFITLGLSATRRFSNPALTNDGAGTFFAGGGSNDGFGASAFIGALWNFDFFVKVAGHAPASDFDFKLLYDFDPSPGTADSDLGIWDLNSFINAVNPAQSSQNLLFGFLANSLIPEITAPPGSFDPNAGGEYSFALIASQGITSLGRSAIDVNVSAVPVPAALPLFGTGLFVMGFVGWRRRKAAAKVAA